MEEMKKKFPSLPPNYVSLQQLQEQRLRDQEHKQREKEEEERKLEEQKLKEEQEKQQRLKEEEERKLQEHQEALGIKTKASSDRAYKKNREKFSGRHRRSKEKIDSELQNQETEIIVAVEAERPDPEQKLEEPIKKTKSSKDKKKGRKPKAEETIVGDLKELLPSENGLEETAPVDMPEKSTRKKEIGNGSRRWSKKPSPEEVGDSLNQTVEVARRIGDLRVGDDDKRVETDGGKEVNGNTSTAEMNGGRTEVRRSRKFGNGGKQRDDSLVWIRKTNISDGIPASFHCSSGGRRRRS